jgi:sigma-B regulation protein RsbU (phosphoserine phosphatase)
MLNQSDRGPAPHEFWWPPRLMHFGGLVFLALCASAFAVPPAELTQWRSGLTEVDQGWVEHDGDDMQWARPDLDDTAWSVVSLDDLGPAAPGWRWYRRHVHFGSDQPEVHFLLAGGKGTYELYVNGIRVPGPSLQPALLVSRPVEAVFPLSDENGNFEIALRTRIPRGYASWHLPQFTNVTIGLPTAIEYESQALESQRLYGAAPSICINVLLCLAGIGALAFFANQRSQREYLFVGLYLFLAGISNGLSALQSCGLVPLSVNFLIADPLIYVWVLAQVEFTYSFAGRHVGQAWRVYETFLVVPIALAGLTWMGWFRSDYYALIEGAVTAPVGLLLSVLLLIWYRRGNREAGWLIVPSLAPAVSNALLDLGTASILLGWRPLNSLVEPVQFGPVALQTVDVGTLLFLLSIALVMFFRFGRVSREQARSAAELEAAREIQRSLVPEILPALPNCSIEAAYLPAQEVGGDFYQAIPQSDGSTLVVIGDVSGKGLRAAMTGALAIGALRAIARETSNPAALLGRLNGEIVQGQDGGFVTCLCVRVGDNGEVTIANAGHLPPYQNGKELALEPALPLGMVPELAYLESRFQFSPGDTLTLLSDGVVEARDPTGELFGFERTQALSNVSAFAIAAAAQQFGQEDDITVLTLRLIPVESGAVRHAASQ